MIAAPDPAKRSRSSSHTLLIDKRDLCAGASDGNHGLLYSVARYVSYDLLWSREEPSFGVDTPWDARNNILIF